GNAFRVRPATADGSSRGLIVTDGTFELRGCDPGKTYRACVLDAPRIAGTVFADTSPTGRLRPVYRLYGLDNLFRDGKGRLGALIEVPAKEAAGKPLTVRMAPCSSAEVR